MLENLKHSYVDLDDPRRLEFDYVRWIGDAIDGAARRGAPLDAVFLGGAGFTLPRYLLATRPGSRARVLEVDGELVDLARERLGLRTGPDLRVVVGDARVTLADEPTASADVLVGDAFSARAVPWHLATARVRARDPARAASARRLRAQRHRPAAAAARARRGGDAAGGVRRRRARRPAPAHVDGNLVLLASEARLPAEVAGEVTGRSPARPRARLDASRAGMAPLRDLDAPADQLISR